MYVGKYMHKGLVITADHYSKLFGKNVLFGKISNNNS